MKKENNIPTNKENWFEKYVIKFSPYGDLIVFANKRNIVICTGKNFNDDQIKFSNVSRIELTDNENDIITAIAIIPIASQKMY